MSAHQANIDKAEAEAKELLARAALQLAQSQVMTNDEIRKYLFNLEKFPQQIGGNLPRPVLSDK